MSDYRIVSNRVWAVAGGVQHAGAEAAGRKHGRAENTDAGGARGGGGGLDGQCE